MILYRLRQWGTEQWALLRLDSESELFDEEMLSEPLENLLSRCEGHLQRSEDGIIWEDV